MSNRQPPTRRAAAALAAGLMLTSPALGRASCPAPEPAELPPDPPAPRPLTVRFLGATSLLFDDGVDQILVDGFFSRPPLPEALVGRLSPHPGRIDDGLRKAGVTQRLAAVLVAHAHHDHALDAPDIARRAGALLVGSTSAGWIARGQDLPRECIRDAADGALPFGGFTVTPYRTPHSRPEIFPGEIRAKVPPGARGWRYRGGDNYAYLLVRDGGFGLLVHPSAGARLKPDTYPAGSAQVVFLGVGGMGWWPEDRMRRYWSAVVVRTGAKVVVPIHWDDFGRPLDEGLRPMGLLLDRPARTAKLLRKLACENQVELRPLALFQPAALEPLEPRPPEGCPPRTAPPIGSTTAATP